MTCFLILEHAQQDSKQRMKNHVTYPSRIQYDDGISDTSRHNVALEFWTPSTHFQFSILTRYRSLFEETHHSTHLTDAPNCHLRTHLPVEISHLRNEQSIDPDNNHCLHVRKRFKHDALCIVERSKEEQAKSETTYPVGSTAMERTLSYLPSSTAR